MRPPRSSAADMLPKYGPPQCQSHQRNSSRESRGTQEWLSFPKWRVLYHISAANNHPPPIPHALPTDRTRTENGLNNGRKTGRYGLATDSRSAHIHGLKTGSARGTTANNPHIHQACLRPQASNRADDYSVLLAPIGEFAISHEHHAK